MALALPFLIIAMIGMLLKAFNVGAYQLEDNGTITSTNYNTSGVTSFSIASGETETLDNFSTTLEQNTVYYLYFVVNRTTSSLSYCRVYGDNNQISGGAVYGATFKKISFNSSIYSSFSFSVYNASDETMYLSYIMINPKNYATYDSTYYEEPYYTYVNANQLINSNLYNASLYKYYTIGSTIVRSFMSWTSDVQKNAVSLLITSDTTYKNIMIDNINASLGGVILQYLTSNVVTITYSDNTITQYSYDIDGSQSVTLSNSDIIKSIKVTPNDISTYARLSIFYQNSTYDSAYNDGYEVGYNDGYDNGTNDGIVIGENNGDLAQSGFKTLINTILSYPVNMIRKAFNFELFGINISYVVMFVITLSLVFFVIRKFRK